MFKKTILMTTAAIYFIGIAPDAVAMNPNQDEQQVMGANAVVANRPMRALIGNISKLPSPNKILFHEIFSYLDHQDANSFAEAMHFVPLGARVHDMTERFYQLRVNEIMAKTPEIHRARITALLAQENVLNAPFRSCIISDIRSAVSLFDMPQLTPDNPQLTPDNPQLTPDNVVQELVRITTAAGFVPTTLRAVTCTQHRTTGDILKAIQIGSRLNTVSPDHVAGYMIALCDLLGRPAEGSGVPDSGDALLNTSRIIPALIAVPHARLKHVVNGTLNFMEAAFDVSPRNGWSVSPNVLSKNAYPAVCANVLRSIIQIPAEYLEDYLFVAEIIMDAKKYQVTSINEKQSILAQLIQIPYDSLETVTRIIQDFISNPSTAFVPTSSVIKYLEQTPPDEIDRSIGNLMHIFSDDVSGNIKILESLNRVVRAKRQPVLEATLQFRTAQPNADYRAHMVQHFDRVDSDQLGDYTDVAHAVMTTEFDESFSSMVINELMLTKHIHLGDVSRAALDFLAGHDDCSASMRTRTIRFLREIRQHEEKGQYFQHYVGTWRALNDLLKADHVAEEVCMRDGAAIRIKIDFDLTQILRDLQDIPHDHLDGIRNTAGLFVRTYPHLKSNKTIISALGQANFEHLDEYISAVPRIVNISGVRPTDIMEGQFGQSILRILTNIKHDILPSVVDAATQKIAESSAAGITLSFDEIERIINKCEKVEESKKPRRYYC